MEKFVQFSDEKATSIIAVFLSPQDETMYPNQAVVEDDDERYVAFMKKVSFLAL